MLSAHLRFDAPCICNFACLLPINVLNVSGLSALECVIITRSFHSVGGTLEQSSSDPELAKVEKHVSLLFKKFIAV